MNSCPCDHCTADVWKEVNRLKAEQKIQPLTDYDKGWNDAFEHEIIRLKDTI